MARREIAGGAGVALMVQGPAHRRKSDLVPRDLIPPEEADFEALRPGRDRLVGEPGAVDQLYLAEPRDVVDRQQPLDKDAGARLFPGLPPRASRGGLVQFEIARRQGP